VPPVIIRPPVSVFYRPGHGYLVKLLTIVAYSKLRPTGEHIPADDVTQLPAYPADMVVLQGLVWCDFRRTFAVKKP